MENFVLGDECKMYRGAALLNGASVVFTTPGQWSEVTNARSVDLGLSKSEVDVSIRGSSWKATAYTRKDGSITFELLWKPGDADFDAVRDAWLAGTEIALAVLDGPVTTAGSQGLVANFSVGSFSRSEPLDGAVVASVTAKPSSYIEWGEVPADDELIEVAEYTVNMTAGAATIDLTACGAGGDVDLTDLRVTYIKLEGLATNTAEVVVDTGLANGYNLDATLVVEPGDTVVVTKTVANQIDVDATHKTWDVTGDGTEGVKVTIRAEASA